MTEHAQGEGGEMTETKKCLADGCMYIRRYDSLYCNAHQGHVPDFSGAEDEGARTPLRELAAKWRELSARLTSSPVAMERNEERAEAFDDAAEDLESAMVEGPGEAERLALVKLPLLQAIGDWQENCPCSCARCDDLRAVYSAERDVYEKIRAGAQVPPAKENLPMGSGLPRAAESSTALGEKSDREMNVLAVDARPQEAKPPDPIPFQVPPATSAPTLKEAVDSEIERMADAAAPPAHSLINPHYGSPYCTPSCPACKVEMDKMNAAALQPQEACPHCGVPLTGMNSNPDECLHKPQERPDALRELSELADEMKNAGQIRFAMALREGVRTVAAALDAVRREAFQSGINVGREAAEQVYECKLTEVRKETIEQLADGLQCEGFEFAAQRLRAVATAPTGETNGSTGNL